jgi:hypothetical protein
MCQVRTLFPLGGSCPASTFVAQADSSPGRKNARALPSNQYPQLLSEQLASRTDVRLALASLEFPLIAFLSRPMLAPPPIVKCSYKRAPRKERQWQTRPGQFPGPVRQYQMGMHCQLSMTRQLTEHTTYISLLPPSIPSAPFFCPYRPYQSFRHINLVCSLALPPNSERAGSS